MKGKTFAEKVLNASAGTIVFVKPDIVMTHDNTASIAQTFKKMGASKVANPDQLLIVLDHNAPPTNAALANDYLAIRNFVKSNEIKKFHDAGKGICHQIMASYAKPGMIITGSDSHTCTAGAFNTFAVGIDRTEAAGLWVRGETWLKVPETIKITFSGTLQKGVYAKDLALWLIGILGTDGANYMSIEFHGEGIKSLSVSDRMTISNLASEMGAKNAVFPADEILATALNEKSTNAIWADENAIYSKEININLSDIYPVVAAPHSVENIKAVHECEDISVQQGLIGTCTNGRIEDLRIAVEILHGKKIAENFQLHIIPASQEIYLQAINEGIITKLIEAGATILASSCGPCLGTGQGIPADNINVISSANRNFPGRMGNKHANIYLASPATVALSAITGKISNPVNELNRKALPCMKRVTPKCETNNGENRKFGFIWNYSDIDNLNTDQMFAGNLTYNIKSSEPKLIVPHLLKGFDENFADSVQTGDIIIAGENFGCGSSREHPAVGFVEAGIKAIIAKSVNRIFFRSCINQGLLLIVSNEIVCNYTPGDLLELYADKGVVLINKKEIKFPVLPEKLMEILKFKGLENLIKSGI